MSRYLHSSSLFRFRDLEAGTLVVHSLPSEIESYHGLRTLPEHLPKGVVVAFNYSPIKSHAPLKLRHRLLNRAQTSQAQGSSLRFILLSLSKSEAASHSVWLDGPSSCFETTNRCLQSTDVVIKAITIRQNANCPQESFVYPHLFTFSTAQMPDLVASRSILPLGTA